MGREIKFRGKSIKTHELVYGCLVVDETGETCIVNNYGVDSYDWEEVDPETIGQYTGLPDKNSKGIYEGDIVQYSYVSPLSKKLVIDRYRIGTDKSTLIKMFHSSGLQRWDRFLWMQSVHIEIIGNIHENPELMEGDPK